jgi:PKD repeat protein
VLFRNCGSLVDRKSGWDTFSLGLLTSRPRITGHQNTDMSERREGRLGSGTGKSLARKVVATFLLAVSVPFSWGGEILPVDRSYPWGGNVGIPGGIPNLTAVSTTLNPSGGDDQPQIQNALNASQGNQVVKLNPGVYNLSSRLDFGSVKDGTVLRGSGTNTILRFNDASTACILMRSSYSDTLGTGVDLAVDAVKGGTNVTLTTVPSWLKVSHLYVIDQTDDPSFVTAGTTQIWETGNDYRYNFITTAYGHRGMSQLVKVTAISGNTVSFEMPLTYGFSKAQAARLWKSAYDSATTGPRRRCGIEDLKIVGNFADSSCHTIYMENCDNCWIKNVESDMVPGLDHVMTFYSYRCEIRGSYFHDAKSFGAGQGYGIGLYNGSTGFLIENNILKTLHLAISFNYGSCANVASYNALLEGQDDGMNKSIVSVSGHGSHHHFNLLEGNYAANVFNFDIVHGSGSHNVIFRNRVMGTNHINEGESCINLEYYNRRYSVIGNVLGSPEHRIFEIVAPSTCSSSADKPIFKIGHRNSYGCSTGCVGGGSCYDTLVVNGVLRALNYDSVNATVVSGGYQVSDLRDSYYLTSKPSWFGDRPWPPYSPSNASAAVLTNIPAGYRFIFGENPPTGPQNLPPVVSANGSPLSGPAPLQVVFSSAGSRDPEGGALTYNWNFGDGTTASSVANPTHSFQADGNYSVRLTVSDGTNSATSGAILVVVGNQPPNVSASANPTSGAAPLSVQFSSAGTSDPEGQPLQYSWNFGDGTTSSGASPTHIYNVVGQYSAVLTVSDGVKSAQKSVTINVHDASGLVAAFSFDEGSGPTVTDLSGNGNNGTISGATWGAGRYGSALNFNGTSSMVTIPDSASLDLTGAMTLEAWVNPSAVGGWRDIIYKGAIDKYLLLGSTPAASAPGTGGTFNGPVLAGSSPLAVNTWSHLAATYDRTTLRLFVNGVQVASRNVTAAIEVSTGALTIGGDTDYGQFWQGAIDNIRIYNRALSATEIQDNMSAPVGAQKPTPPQNLRIVAP